MAEPSSSKLASGAVNPADYAVGGNYYFTSPSGSGSARFSPPSPIRKPAATATSPTVPRVPGSGPRGHGRTQRRGDVDAQSEGHGVTPGSIPNRATPDLPYGRTLTVGPITLHDCRGDRRQLRRYEDRPRLHGVRDRRDTALRGSTMTTAQDLRSGLAHHRRPGVVRRPRTCDRRRDDRALARLGNTHWPPDGRPTGSDRVVWQGVHRRRDRPPLLFGEPGDLYAVNPKLVPMNTLTGVASRVPRVMPPGGRAAFRGLRTLQAARPPARHLLPRRQRRAAMVYDDIPVIDHFRRVDDTTLLGVMDQRGADQPYFSSWRRTGPRPSALGDQPSVINAGNQRRVISGVSPIAASSSANSTHGCTGRG